MVERVRLQNFRAFKDQHLDLGRQSLIVGQNGAGKSTVIEALRLLSINKSFRTNKLEDAIHFNAPYFRLTAELKNNKKQAVEFFYGEPGANQLVKERQISVNNKPVSVIEYVGTLPSVLFVPDDVEIVLGQPSLRRKYLDGILWQVDKAFRREFIEMGRVLRERSAVLFLLKLNRAGRDELEPWNELLLNLTGAIRGKRQALVKYLNKQAKELINKEDFKLNFSFTYQTEVETLEEVEVIEIKNAQNFFGPHRDELDITMNDRSARQFSSRGQARVAAVLLKIIETSYLREELGSEPLVLLDDMFSELDERNAAFLFSHLSTSGQVVATSLATQPLLKNWPVIKLP